MVKKMNILITSVGIRNKIIQYFMEEMGGKGKVITTDTSENAPAIYESHKYYIVPRIDEPNYLNVILDICKKEEIDAVSSLIDPELLLLSKNRELFEKNGVKVLVSDYELIQLATNKFNMNAHLQKNGFNYIPSYLSVSSFMDDYKQNKVDFPVFVKPVDGSASTGIKKIECLKDLESYSDKEGILIQKFMNGKELGADVYIDYISGEINSIFVKEKIRMRAGETDKSIEYYDEKLEKLIHKFIQVTPFRGIIDIDIFMVGDEYYISEVNPRFGGGYLHGHEVGFKATSLLIQNLNDKINKGYRINKGNTKMLKYPSTIIK